MQGLNRLIRDLVRARQPVHGFDSSNNVIRTSRKTHVGMKLLTTNAATAPANGFGWAASDTHITF